MPYDSVQQLLLEKLRPPIYREIDPYTVNWKEARTSFAAWFKRWRKALKEECLQKMIFKDIEEIGEKGFIARIIPLVKTHKEPGSVSFRLVHNFSGHPFRMYGSIIQKMLRTVVKERCPHICESSDGFCQKISGLALQASDRLVRLDIKDFYLCGKHENLAEICMQNNEAGYVGTLLLELVLGWQYVATPFLPDRVWAVTSGSGIGMQLS